MPAAARTSWPAVDRPLAAESAIAWLNDAEPMGFAQTMKTFFCTPGRPAPHRRAGAPSESVRCARRLRSWQRHARGRGAPALASRTTAVRRRRDHRRDPVGAPPHEVADRLQRLPELRHAANQRVRAHWCPVDHEHF